LNSLLIHNLKGTTFSNFIEKGRYNSEGNACITMQGFIYMAHIALIDMVANSFHTTFGDSPHNLWIQAIEQNPHLKLQIPSNIISLKIMIMAGSKLRKIQQQGVVIENEYYFSKELMDLKNLLEKYNREDEDVRVRYDLSDMREVYVFDQINNRYIVCEQKGFERKKINTELPVPYEVLEIDSKIRVENKKSFNPSARAISKRKVREIQKQTEKEIKKWKNGEEPDQTRDSSLITTVILKTNTNLNLPLENNDLVLLEKEPTTPNKKKKKKNNNVANEEVVFMEFDDTDLEDLPSWTVNKRN
jgi:putative transposase